MIHPILKAAVLTAVRAIRLAEFNFSQELMGHDLSDLTDPELALLENQVTEGTTFSYKLGLNAFCNERWSRERIKRELAEVDRLEVEELEQKGLL